ncbi:MAG: hypothetical protein RL701_2158 [Pseudomonadota bacterium]
MLRKCSVFGCGVWLVALWLGARSVQAQVIEPNGLVVPVAPTTANEISVQRFFEARTPPEPIDAVAQASTEPATFSPRCGFQAELVLSQSSAAAGLAWYNVPSDPHAAPSALYQLVPETTQPGALVSSNEIRSDPNYAGGFVGFALTKFGGKAIYYSEAQRNVECTACSLPGYWKLMLAYPSPLTAATYYLAWEDWEGANASRWPDDGDFNDKVFRLTGVRCAGGGEPCDTGRPGVCAAGLTGCSAGASPGECASLDMGSAEACDGLDNDCDADSDEGAPCAAGEACMQGHCTHACGGDEFGCDTGMLCEDGRCIAAACAGVRCEVGKVCAAGSCKAPCDGVLCPLGQVCRSGVCKDPCAGVVCQTGSVCRLGACLESCQCSGCPSGEACSTAGQCVSAGCEGKVCAAGDACVLGACVDACKDARCPGGVSCERGQCLSTGTLVAPVTTNPSAAATGGVGGSVVAAGSAASLPSAAAGTPAARALRPLESADGCGCHVIGAGRRPVALSAGLGSALFAVLCLARSSRRRRR